MTVAEFCERVRDAAHGVLTKHVYIPLYETAYRAGGGVFVEIGTAQGAATIIMASAALAAQVPFHLYTVDRFGGRRHEVFGGSAGSIAFAQAQFKRFAVDAHITVIVGTSEELVAQHDVRDVTLLLLDADGQIDRDLAALAGRLATDCIVVIDDIDDKVYLKEGRLDLKHRLSHLLTTDFVARGWLRPVKQIAKGISGVAGFYESDGGWTSDEMLMAALPLYRKLVFSRLD